MNPIIFTSLNAEKIQQNTVEEVIFHAQSCVLNYVNRATSILSALKFGCCTSY